MKKRLQLKDLKLRSFVTELPKSAFIRGGEENSVACETEIDCDTQTTCDSYDSGGAFGCTNSFDRTIITNPDAN